MLLPSAAGAGSSSALRFRADPVIFEPETGLALLYPQGDQCTVQEEAEATEDRHCARTSHRIVSHRSYFCPVPLKKTMFQKANTHTGTTPEACRTAGFRCISGRSTCSVRMCSSACAIRSRSALSRARTYSCHQQRVVLHARRFARPGIGNDHAQVSQPLL